MCPTTYLNPVRPLLRCTYTRRAPGTARCHPQGRGDSGVGCGRGGGDVHPARHQALGALQRAPRGRLVQRRVADGVRLVVGEALRGGHEEPQVALRSYKEGSFENF